MEPIAIQGICALRAGRVSLEREAGGQFLTVQISTQFEEHFGAGELTATANLFTFDNGQTVPPLRDATRDMFGRMHDPYHTGKTTSTASIRLTEGLRACKTFSVSGTLDFTPYEMQSVSVELTEKKSMRRFPGGLTLTVTPGVADVKASLTSDGASLPLNMNGNDFLTAVDSTGKRVGSVNSTSSNGGRSIEVGLSIPEGVNAARAIVRVPRSLSKVSDTFTLSNVPMPLTEKLPETPAPASTDDF